METLLHDELSLLGKRSAPSRGPSAAGASRHARPPPRTTTRTTTVRSLPSSSRRTPRQRPPPWQVNAERHRRKQQAAVEAVRKTNETAADEPPRDLPGMDADRTFCSMQEQAATTWRPIFGMPAYPLSSTTEDVGGMTPMQRGRLYEHISRWSDHERAHRYRRSSPR